MPCDLKLYDIWLPCTGDHNPTLLHSRLSRDLQDFHVVPRAAASCSGPRGWVTSPRDLASPPLSRRYVPPGRGIGHARRLVGGPSHWSIGIYRFIRGGTGAPPRPAGRRTEVRPGVREAQRVTVGAALAPPALGPQGALRQRERRHQLTAISERSSHSNKYYK